MEKIEVDGRLYVNHPHWGWLRLGSWGWGPVPAPREVP